MLLVGGHKKYASEKHRSGAWGAEQDTEGFCLFAKNWILFCGDIGAEYYLDIPNSYPIVSKNATQAFSPDFLLFLRMMATALSYSQAALR